MMKSLACTVLALGALAATGCHTRTSKFLEFTLTPNAAAHTVTVECTSSSTDKCFFTFTGNHPTTASVHTGAIFTVRDLSPDALYCADVHQPSLDTCKQTSLPTGRVTVRSNSTTDSRASD